MNNEFSIGLGGWRRIEFHGQHDEQDFQVTLADTGQATMTGGRVRRFLGDATTFLVT
jgi:glucose-1-phosphate cytidylyltransferase